MNQDGHHRIGPLRWLRMGACACIVWVGALGLLSVPPARAAGLRAAQMFPCIPLTLGSPREHPAPEIHPLVVKTARNETHLLLFSLEQAEARDIRVELQWQGAQGRGWDRNRPVYRPAPPACTLGLAPSSWLETQVFLVCPLPANLPDHFFTDGMVPLDSVPVVRTEFRQPLLMALRLRTTPGHPPGRFRYHLLVHSNGLTSCLPLEVQVWNFALPDELDLDLMVSKWETNPTWYARYGVNHATLFSSILPASLAALRRYKINGLGPFYPLPVAAIAKGTPISAFPEFVELLHQVTDVLNFRRIRPPRLEGAETMGQPGSTFAARAPVYYGQWRDFLLARGLLDRASIKVWDEPQPEDYARVLQAYGLIKTICPECATESAGATPPPELAAALNIWAHHLLAFDPAAAAAAARQGMQPWLYANRLHGIDHPPSHQRLIGWFLKQWQFSGYLLWAANYWPTDPWTTLPGPADAYRRGTFFYPDPASGFPWPTLRLEALLRGLEDYQYFSLLDSACREGQVSAALCQQVKARLEDLTADMESCQPAATWAELEEVRIMMGEALHGRGKVARVCPDFVAPGR